LLISILTPSLVNVKNIARTAKTAALLKGLGDGLEMFHTDHVLQADRLVSGDYPPSYFPVTVPARNPYQAENQDPCNRTSPYNAQGAQTLVWGLVGADLQGTPGFQAAPEAQMQYDGTPNVAKFNQTMNYIYRLDSNKRLLFARREPFVDITKARVRNPDPSIMLLSGTLANAAVPVYLDEFNMPVLYYKPRTLQTSPEPTYVRTDNQAFTQALLGPTLRNPIGNLAMDKDGLNAFQRYIRNTQITNTYRPHNADTFILISAGADELYGTSDDVANFPLDAYNYQADYWR